MRCADDDGGRQRHGWGKGDARLRHGTGRIIGGGRTFVAPPDVPIPGTLRRDGHLPPGRHETFGRVGRYVVCGPATRRRVLGAIVTA